MTNGAELTVDDVVYTANVWKEQCASNDTGKFIENVTKVDENTVTITFTIAAPDVLEMLTWSNYGIVAEAEICLEGYGFVRRGCFVCRKVDHITAACVCVKGKSLRHYSVFYCRNNT